MVVLDFSAEEFDGAEVEKLLDQVGISVSKSLIPHDPRPPFRPSGVRIGISAMTTRGILEEDVRKMVLFIDKAIRNRGDQTVLEGLKKQIQIFLLFQNMKQSLAIRNISSSIFNFQQTKNFLDIAFS